MFAQGPTFDTSGNGMLKGTYYFRHILYGIDASGQSGTPGTINEAIAVYGNIAFDGNGNYTMVSAAVSDSGNQVYSDPLACYLAGLTSQSSCSGSTVAGTYSVSSSGFGFISNPITNDRIYGLVSANNIFVGSSTEATQSYNDMFIAALVPSPAPTNSFFSGTYTVAGFFPGGSPLSSEDAFFQLTPNGAGSLGQPLIGGYLGNGSTVSQGFSSNISYNFQNGAAIVTFPVNNNGAFFPGGTTNPEYFYFSPDGNFFFGGSPTTGFDMIVGVRNASGNQNFSGLYYQAGIDQDNSNLATGYADFDGFFGSMNVLSSGIILQHQRVSSAQYGIYGYTFADSFTPPITGNFTDTAASVQYSFGGGGVVRISEDIWPYLGLSVALQAPNFSAPASGVYIYPTGIVNQATFSPFTAGVSNGEMVTIFGNNLAPGTVPNSGLPLKTGLDGVTVTVNGTPAPLFYVSPTQILINVPYEATLACAQVSNMSCYAQFQVTNASGTSNAVTEVLNATTPGVFTGNSGLGYGYVQHSDYSLVTPSHPAQPGETVMAYVSGLGNVSPIVTDGAAAPGGENAVNTITAYIGGISAPVTFAGLVPTLTGLYQVNLTVPSTAPAGDNTIDISGPDSDTSEALISIGSGTAAADRKAALKGRHAIRARSSTPRPPACFGAKCL